MDPVRSLPITSDFTYSRLKKLIDAVPFTQKDRAGILHLSERTRQCYATDQKSFEGLYADRLLQIEQLIALGLKVFTNGQTLNDRLRSEKKVMGQMLDFNSLSSAAGIRLIMD